MEWIQFPNYKMQIIVSKVEYVLCVLWSCFIEFEYAGIFLLIIIDHHWSERWQLSCRNEHGELFCPLSLLGFRSDPTAKGDHGDPASPHETAIGSASQGGQEAEGEAEASPPGCRK